MASESVVLLFTDIVGSTELSSRMAPDDADELRRKHFATLRRAIARTGGREVKNTGDGLMACFRSPSTALSCAVGMQQGVDRDNRGQEHVIGLRVGLSGGEVTPDEGDYFGDPVIEAARLCNKCNGGQILAARVVQLMAGRRNLHECTPVGALWLAGLPEAVESVEVVWEPLADDAGYAIPLPQRLAYRPSVGVVGRDDELGAIDSAMQQVASGGDHEVLLVAGEAGLGKTTLVAEAARAAVDGGACVLFGHCEEDVATPYELFAESLAHYVEHAPEALLLEQVDTHGSELVRLVPALAERIPNLPPSKATDPDTERYLLFAAVVAFLAAASVHTPIVLVLDDLQWADSGSLSLLRHVAASEQSMRVLILGTYRDSELAQADALRDTLGVLHRHRGISRLNLSGLDNEAVASFIEAAAGHSLDEAGVAFAHEVFVETDGNPFFLGEMLRHLDETGLIERDDRGRWVTTQRLDWTSLPESVRDVVAGRVARLGPDAARLLSVAAVVGRDFDLGTVTAASNVSEDDALDALDAAAAVALVREIDGAEGRYMFAHALIQHTMYDELGATRRARTHWRVAEALEAHGEPHSPARVRELARHWMHATRPINSAKAIEYSRQAADTALGALAPAEALHYYDQALALCGEHDNCDPSLLVDLAINRGTAQRQSGDAGYRETLLDAARQAISLGDTHRLAAAALANDRGFYSAVGTIDAERVSVLETALEALGDDDHRARALVLATLCSELAHGSTLERRQALAYEAIAIAERSGDDATVVRVLNHVFIPLQVPHLIDLALDRTAKALVRAEEVGDPALIFWAAMWRGETAARAGDIAEFDRCLAIHGEIAEALAQPMFTWAHTWSVGLRVLIGGDTDRAEELATQALAIGTDCGQPDAGLIYGAQLMSVRGQRGTMSELIPLIEQMAADAPDISPWMFASLLAKAQVEVGKLDDARRKLGEFAAADFELPLDQLWLSAMVDFADAAMECGDEEFAKPIYERLLPWSTLLPCTGATALAPVAFYLGGLATVLGRYDDAEAHLTESAAMSERMKAAFFAARTDAELGRMLVARDGTGDTERARPVLRRAQAVAIEQKYANVERLASDTLARIDA